MKSKFIRRLCAAAACAMMLAAAQAEEAPALLEPAGVRLASVRAEMGDMLKVTVLSGSVIPYVQELSFEIDGEIGEVSVVVGQRVKKGDVLLTIDQEQETERCAELREEIAALEANAAYDDALAQIDLEILSLELERLGSQLPQDDRAIALKRLEIEQFELSASLSRDLSAMKLDRLRAELESLESASVKAELTAPFDGQVMFIEQLHSGSRVSAYSPLIYLADDSQLMIESDYITETSLGLAHDLYALVDGRRVEISPQPLDDAEILTKALSGEKLTSRFDVAPGSGISAGQYAAVCLESGYIENTLIVPANTLFIGPGGRYVYVVEDGVRVRRDVRVGATNNCQAQILDGLKEGENVYVPD